MATKRKSKKNTRSNSKTTSRHQSSGPLYSVFSFIIIILLILAVFHLGMIGMYIDAAFNYLFGFARFFIYLLILLICIYIGSVQALPKLTRRMTGFLLLILSVMIMAHSIFLAQSNRQLHSLDHLKSAYSQSYLYFNGGGLIGDILTRFLTTLISPVGTIMIGLIVLFIALVYMMNKHLRHVLHKLFSSFKDNSSKGLNQSKQFIDQRREQKRHQNEVLTANEQESVEHIDGKDHHNMTNHSNQNIDIEVTGTTERPYLEEQPKKEQRNKRKRSKLFAQSNGKEDEQFEHDSQNNSQQPLQNEENDTVDQTQPSNEINIFSHTENDISNQSDDINQTNRNSDDEYYSNKKDIGESYHEDSNHQQEDEGYDASQMESMDEALTNESERALKKYKLPPMSLLSTNSSTFNHDKAAIKEKGQLLENTLKNFGVNAKVTQIKIGPAVTQYEVQPAVGVKVSKIVNLHNDIALALAAKDIRIEAPIPGKSAIGIEVPNGEVSMVTLREVLTKGGANHPLEVALGKDISGMPITAKLNKMPHLLVAGATGSGKSVCINGIIISILLNARPDEVRLMMIDPKMVELNIYNGIPHLLTPVVTNPQKAAQALQKIVSEMERRYDLFSHSNTRNIEGYNDYIERMNDELDEKTPKLPYIVVIVDELADLMMVASKEVESSITRIAQMARAAGIHLIIATQRPSVDVITGIIKANIPSRIAFSVSSSTDSRTIIDSNGADKLLGKGDMLFLPYGQSKPTRIQGAFLSDKEVDDVVSYITNQMTANYIEEMKPAEVNESNDSSSEDDLYPDVKTFVIEQNKASASLIQRQFRVGYNRAARLIDDLENDGIIGPSQGSKPRVVYSQEEDDMNDY